MREVFFISCLIPICVVRLDGTSRGTCLEFVCNNKKASEENVKDSGPLGNSIKFQAEMVRISASTNK